MTSPTNENETEAKVVHQVLAVEIEQRDELDDMMQKFGFWKTIRMTAWVARFIKNCKVKHSLRSKGPVTTEETKAQVNFWIKRVEERCQGKSDLQEDQLQLNLQRNDRGVSW